MIIATPTRLAHDISLITQISTFILEIVPGTWEPTHYLVWMPAPIPLGTVLEMEQNRNIIIEAHKVVRQAVIPETEVLKNINSVFW